MADVKVIPPREKAPEILRVAAYCRVSSDSADQKHSYVTQTRKYTEEIGQHDGWELVDIYADEAVIGTRLDKREDFNRMLTDCRKGRIDKVLVKSVSRFARNTKDCLATLRELMSPGVTVCFEKEDLNTETLTTELMVSVSGALAQKTYTTSVFPYERRLNKGDVDQYYTENSHPAIISRDTFERAQALMKRRAQRVAYVSKEYPLSRKIICGDCGTPFIRRKSPSGYVSWVCRKHDDRAADCPVGRIAETEIYAAFLRMYNKLKHHEDIILKPILAQLRDLNDALQKGKPAMLAVNRAIAETSEQSHWEEPEDGYPVPQMRILRETACSPGQPSALRGIPPDGGA